MINKNLSKIFILSILSLSFLGGTAEARGKFKLTDTKGNKYLFKKDTVFCEEMDLVKGTSYLCEGSAIKTDVAGYQRAVSFDQAFCSPKIEWMICTAAQGLGIVPPNSKLIDHW